MSKLSPVTTGQPTQGIGAAPVVASTQPESPVAVLEPVAAVVAATPPSINPRDPYSAVRAAASAAWLSLEAKEIEVSRYFREIPDVKDGMEMLAKMRHQCDLAAAALQQRIDLGNTERCTGCGKTLEEAHKSQFLMMGSEVDSETGVPMPYRYCGPQCIRERNREKMLPKEERNKLRFDGREMGDVQ